MNKILTLIVTATAISTVALATEPAKPNMGIGEGKWSIRVFYGMPTGDIKDDGEVDSIFGGGLEFTPKTMGQSMSGIPSFGAEYSTSSEGLFGFKVQSYGVYAGYAFPLGQSNGMGGLEAIARAGYFNTRFENDTDDDNRWGFGFDFGLRYKVQKFMIEAFYRQRPSLNSIDNTGFAVGINFPIGN